MRVKLLINYEKKNKKDSNDKTKRDEILRKAKGRENQCMRNE